MKIKQIHKIINIILIFIMMILILNSVVMAIQPNDFEEGTVDAEEIEQTGKNIVKIIQAVGVVVSVVVLMIIGIKYLLGSAQEKAEYKKTLMPYVIGAALTFGASSFAQIAYDFFHTWTSK